MHIRFVRITKCDNHKMYFSQSAQFQHCFFVQVVKHTKCIYHDNSTEKKKKTEKIRLFLKKLLITIKISLSNKKDNLLYIQPLARSDISRNMLHNLTYSVFSCRFFCIMIMD